MVAPLRTTSISIPGFYGMNTTDSGTTLDSGFARIAENCVIEEGGRLGARLGWGYYSQTDDENPAQIDLKGLHRFVDIDGQEFFGCWSDNKFYVDSEGTLTEVLVNKHTLETGSVTSSSTTATVAHVNHGYTTGESVTISGADQAEYNGTYNITVTDQDSFTYTFAGSATTPATGTIVTSLNLSTNGDWQAATLNDAAYLFQRNQDPLFFSPTLGILNKIKNATNETTVTITNSGTVATVTHTAHGLSTGAEVTISGANEPEYNGTWTVTVTGANTYTYTMDSSPSGDATGTITAYWSKGDPYKANTVLAAYGRLWTADTASNKTTVWWSDLLDGTQWDSGTGTVGSLDISGILVNGNDEIVALGAHNGRLIIFCKHNIIIMDDQSAGKRYLDPADMSLIEVIEGIGCIARDSVQNTGVDILFLSESGVRSLGRTIQEKSQPMRDISRNIRDPLIKQVKRADQNKIKSTYSEHFAFYLLAVPEDGIVWCFDTRQAMPDGSAKVTRWNSLTHTDWLAFENKVYMSSPYGISEYKNRRDDGESYDLQYYTPYFNFDMQNIVKIAKHVAVTAYSTYKQKLRLKLNTDYDLNSQRPITIELNSGKIYEYNIIDSDSDTFAEWGLTTTAISGSQGVSTLTDHNGIHYTVDFSTTEDATYDTELKVWLDADTYYYTTDDGTRTRVSLYVPHGDFSAEYGGNDSVDNVKVPVGGSGFVIQLGFESTIDGGFVSIQQVDLYVKQGRLR
jgi:hypothetical protein